MLTQEELLELKLVLNGINEKTAKQINWVIGEAIHFAYMCGEIDQAESKVTFYSDLESKVFNHLNNDSERELLSMIMMKENQK